MGQIGRNIKIEYALVGIVVALTGFEFAFRASIYIQSIVLLCISIYFFYLKKKFNSKFFLLVILFLIPLFFQSLQMGDFYPFLSNGALFIVQATICYLVLEIVKDRFHITYVGFIYFLALFSFIFFPTQFFPSIEESIRNGIGSLIQPLGSAGIPQGYKSKTLIFFTYQHGYGVGYRVIRNSGAFWEPGMFAIFLNLALLINLYINEKKIFSRKNVVFIIAILTTVSTTGYVALLVILFSKYILVNEKYKLVLYLPFFIIFSYVTYTYVWTLDVINNKIESNFHDKDERKSRFGAFLYHFEKLEESPLTGVVFSENKKNKDLDYGDRLMLVSPNGVSYVFFTWGVPVGILYFILFFKGIQQLLKKNRIVSTSIILLFYFEFLLLAFSQDITVRPFYLMILMFTIKKPKNSLKIPIKK